MRRRDRERRRVTLAVMLLVVVVVLTYPFFVDDGDHNEFTSLFDFRNNVDGTISIGPVSPSPETALTVGEKVELTATVNYKMGPLFVLSPYSITPKVRICVVARGTKGESCSSAIKLSGFGGEISVGLSYFVPETDEIFTVIYISKSSMEQIVPQTKYEVRRSTS